MILNSRQSLEKGPVIQGKHDDPTALRGRASLPAETISRLLTLRSALLVRANASKTRSLSKVATASASDDVAEEALAAAEEALVYDPQNPKAHFRRAAAQELLSRYGRAAQSYTHGLQSEPANGMIQEKLRTTLKVDPVLSCDAVLQRCLLLC